MSGHPTVVLVLDEQATAAAHARSADAWWLYATEVMDHLRLPYRTMATFDPAVLTAGVGVVVLAHMRSQDPATRARLEEWVNAGGALITVGDPSELGALLGVEAADDHGADAGSLLDGHVDMHSHEMWTDQPDVALTAIGGVRLTTTAADVDVVGSWEDGSTAIAVRRVGDGVAMAWGVDVWQSIVRIQQGVPVTSDGTPPADGSAPIDDGLLKCEDGLVLDFERDRALPPGEPEHPDGYEHVIPPASGLPMFHRPHADLWRSLLLQCVWWAAEHVGAAIPWLHYWPAGVPAVAHMSHDSDLNVDEHGRTALEVFAEADVKVTWCQLFPGGYEPETYAAINEAGHEQALHYNAMHDADIAQWGWPQIRAQYAWAQAVTGVERIVSNKNHYTRWEGYTEFYDWCERLGIEIDQSRGSSKQGTVGFPFGTCHVSFPVAGPDAGNRYYDVLNLPLHTQDLAWAGHESVRDVIMDSALAQHGVAHFLFHGPHLHLRPPTRKACLALAEEARRRGMPWWTSAEINRWERTRRQIRLAIQRDGAGWRVESSATEPLAGAAILLMLPQYEGVPQLTAGSGSVSRVRRHGRDFVELAVDIPAGVSSWQLITEGQS